MSRPQHQPISWICLRWFLFQQKFQKSYPKQYLNGDFTSLLQSYGKKSANKKKNNQNIQVFFYNFPKLHPIIPSYPSILLPPVKTPHLPNSPQLYFLAPPAVARPPAPRSATIATPFWKVWARPLVAKHKRLISTSGIGNEKAGWNKLIFFRPNFWDYTSIYVVSVEQKRVPGKHTIGKYGKYILLEWQVACVCFGLMIQISIKSV